MNDELKIIWKDEVVAELRYYLGICTDGMRKAMKNHSQDSHCLGPD
jgi:hypothetical protein